MLTFNNNDMSQNIYLTEGIMIDAGCSPADLEAIRKSKIEIKAILLTHGHWDHIIAINELKKLTGAPIYCHEAEKQMLEDASINRSAFRDKKIEITPDKLFKDGDTFGNFRVIHTPGHTVGGVCYYDEKAKVLFTGDTLFKEGVGRTDLPAGNHELLLKGIAEKLFILPDDTTVFPGHGKSSTIGHEKANNRHFNTSV